MHLELLSQGVLPVGDPLLGKLRQLQYQLGGCPALGG
jgi:hypothetical protein